MIETNEPQRSAKLFLANSEGLLLVLMRGNTCSRNEGKIDLPGGKQKIDLETGEPLEDIEQTALRELFNETGILEHEVILRGVAHIWQGMCDDGRLRERHYFLGTTEAEPRRYKEHISHLWVPAYTLPSGLPNVSDAETALYAHEVGLLDSIAA